MGLFTALFVVWLQTMSPQYSQHHAWPKLQAPWATCIRLFSHDGKVRILNFNSKCAF